MTYVPLTEFTRPRVLMLDFSEQDVMLIRQTGFDARRGATGVYENDRSQFHFPFAVQDPEVVCAQIKKGSFLDEGRGASPDSVEEKPFFKALMRETWEKLGWSVLFISQDTPPEELEAVGLDQLGVISYSLDSTKGKKYTLALLRTTLLRSDQ
jgi:hypothetical protein